MNMYYERVLNVRRILLDIKVELKATPQMTSEPCTRSSYVLSSGMFNAKSLSGQDNPDNLEVSFQITIKDKMKYHAVTMMKVRERKILFSESRVTSLSVISVSMACALL